MSLHVQEYLHFDLFLPLNESGTIFLNGDPDFYMQSHAQGE